MSEYVQCPNCGGYKVSSQEINETKVFKEKYKFSIAAWLFLTFGCAGVTYIGTTFLLAVIFKMFPSFIHLSLLSILILFSIICVAGFIPFIFAWLVWKENKTRERKGVIVSNSKTVIAGYNYTCRICGNHWRWNKGDTLPKVTLRPDLIAQVESQRWTCSYCGTSNDGTRGSCYVCTYPKPS